MSSTAHPADQANNRRTAWQPSPIDMIDVRTALEALAVCETQLLDLVNRGALAAYTFAGPIRFRRRDVYSLASRLAA